MTVNLARYKPTGEFVTVRRINLEACTNEMVAFLQVELAVLCRDSLAHWRESPCCCIASGMFADTFLGTRNFV